MLRGCSAADNSSRRNSIGLPDSALVWLQTACMYYPCLVQVYYYPVYITDSEELCCSSADTGWPGTAGVM